MTALSFSKLIPGGNPTILLHDPDLDGPELARISARLMSPLHLQAEQVGALHPGRADGATPPRLRMMGGEFCVNAARCAALLLARQGALRLVAPTPAPGAGRGPAGAEASGTDAAGAGAAGAGASGAGVAGAGAAGAGASGAGVAGAGASGAGAAGAGPAGVDPTAASGRDAARSGSEADAPVWGGTLEVSGAAAPVRVLVSPVQEALERVLLHGCALEEAAPDFAADTAALKTADPASLPVDAALADPPRADGESALFCAARIQGLETAFACACAGPGLSRVAVPGIVHLLADTWRHALPDTEGGAWQAASAALRAQTGLERAPASGVVWVEEREGEFAVWPAVRVLATESEHLESACGSASLALALRLWSAPGALRGTVRVRQPSGELLCVHPDPRLPDAAWVSGRVALVAEGVAHL